MTTSNGEGSGWLFPGTGVMANNMMGEDDLHPAGFHAAPPGQRVASMMAPSIVVDPAGVVELVVGSGGSKRIRTALAAGDRRRRWTRVARLADAVDGPRLHWDGAHLHVEPGWSAAVVAALEARWPVTRWPQRRPLLRRGARGRRPARAAADPRRGGASFVGVPSPS